MALSRIAEVDASYSGFILTSALSQELLLRAAEDERLADLYSNAATGRDCAVAFCSFTNPAQLTVLPGATPSIPASLCQVSWNTSSWADFRAGRSSRRH